MFLTIQTIVFVIRTSNSCSAGLSYSKTGSSFSVFIAELSSVYCGLVLQWIYSCSAICCCFFEIFTGKNQGGVKDQTLSNIFFGNLPVYILIFASIIFILVRKKNIVWRVYFILLEYNGESRPDKWRNSGMAEKLVIRKVFWIKEAGAFEAPGQTKEELCANDTSRHPKVFKLGAEHGCQ